MVCMSTCCFSSAECIACAAISAVFACSRHASMMVHASSKWSGMCSSYECPLPCTSTTLGASASCDLRKATISATSRTHCLWKAKTFRSKQRCFSKMYSSPKCALPSLTAFSSRRTCKQGEAGEGERGSG